MEKKIYVAIPTDYKGCHFRSRLEARWAMLFDGLGMPWEYEVERFDVGSLGSYLPDFWLPEWKCYAEVKPKPFTEDEWDRAIRIETPCILLDGRPRVDRLYTITGSDWIKDAYARFAYAIHKTGHHLAGVDFELSFMNKQMVIRSRSHNGTYTNAVDAARFAKFNVDDDGFAAEAKLKTDGENEWVKQFADSFKRK